MLKILYIFQRHKDIVHKDKDYLPKIKTAQICTKDESSERICQDADSKDKDTKYKLDIFLM